MENSATVIDHEQEKKDILKAYRRLLSAAKRNEAKGDLKLVRKAFDVALDAHKDMRRKSGEPYIYHPIAVAEIVTSEIGLGAKSIVCALLHDTVEDTDLTVEDMRRMFGDKVANIIDGLTKLNVVLDMQEDKSMQAENFRKMLLTMSSDIRVILIKLADRLHNMRTLDSMRRDKQLKIASETMFIYAPLAHRLGLYAIKTELEDLAFKYIEPDVFNEITSKLKESEKQRNRFINKFSLPIIKELEDAGLDFDIKGRTKSVYSIARKMRKQGVPFEEVYDLFAIRIILNSDGANEKPDCWKAYSLVTQRYVPSPARFRDWISSPKSNGYESLHTTVMSNEGKWVEVQIRTRRMDDIAEKGLAAHWKYKDAKSQEAADAQKNQEKSLDGWLARIRELLESPDPNAIDFIDDFKLNLFAEEIFVFTPKGEVKTLPAGATALDFAFEIHSAVGMRCIGTKVNGKLFPLSHELKSGDQVEVLTSSKQKPKEDWLAFVVTAKARSNIKQALKEENRSVAADGKELLERKMKQWKFTMNNDSVNKICGHFKLSTSQDLFIKVARRTIDFKDIKDFLEQDKAAGKWYNVFRKKVVPSDDQRKAAAAESTAPQKGDMIVIGDASQRMDYTLAKCCTPIPGDDVFGFVTINDGIKIHRTNCPNAINIRSNYAYRVVPANWANSEEHTAFVTNLLIKGIDDVGLVNAITKVISKDLNVNMQRISFESNDGVFEGHIRVMVEGVQHLNNLIANLRKVDGIKTIVREDIEVIG